MTGQYPLSTLNSALLFLIGLLSLTYAGQSVAQGQDTTPWSRDLQVIEVMLPGFYSNANQAYFDGRRKVHNPVARSSFPMTSSQEYGWSGEMIKDNNLGEHNRRSCRETRFQQHIALGPRHKSGYGGQGGVL